MTYSFRDNTMKYLNDLRKIVGQELTQSEQEYKDKIESLELNVKLIQEEINTLKDQCPHKIYYKPNESVWCSICSKDFGWHCKNSPDHSCHYSNELLDISGKFIVNLHNGQTSTFRPREIKYLISDECLFCGEPDERI